MLTATLVGVFFIPLFFSLISRLSEGRASGPKEEL
jgi:hypothetical protein